jgi:flavin reductase (DIM6/NTAB) family NADH-FMN oxidoreductase RutF
MEDQPEFSSFFTIFEVKVILVHVTEDIIMKDHENRIDPDKWRPLIMSFQRLYGLSGEVASSVLARVEEEYYRLPVD